MTCMEEGEGRRGRGPLIASLIWAGSDINNVIDPFFALHKFSRVTRSGHNSTSFRVLGTHTTHYPKIQMEKDERIKIRGQPGGIIEGDIII